MKALATKTLLIAATLLAPTSAVLAADNAFAGYERGILGMAAAPTQGGTANTSMPCGRDPFAGYRAGFNSGGPAQVCHDMPAGAQGPAGPTLAAAWSDPFAGYKRGISTE